MSRKALALLLLPLAAAACTPGHPRHGADPTRLSPAQRARNDEQRARGIDRLEARLAHENAACRRGDHRACVRADAARAALDDLRRSPEM